MELRLYLAHLTIKSENLHFIPWYITILYSIFNSNKLMTCLFWSPTNTTNYIYHITSRVPLHRNPAKKPEQIQFHPKSPHSITKIELQHKHGQNYSRVNEC
jgi:hypothetical protein